MKVTVIGAGNSGLAMSAHLSKEGNEVTLWNRSKNSISKLMMTNTIYCEGVIQGAIKIHKVTDDLREALENPDLILVTTPASSHKELAGLIAQNITKSTIILLNPGRTFGALEFHYEYSSYSNEHSQLIAETQTIIYTCRKISDDTVNIITFKDSVLLSGLDPANNSRIIESLPICLRDFLIPADSIVQTSIGNVGMILHCAPLLLNTGWTESSSSSYKYYYDGITPSVAKILEKIDHERIEVSKALGFEVESTLAWLKRTYHIEGSTLYGAIQNNEAYKTIDAPNTIMHRYILEDVPCGLVPLEAVGIRLGVSVGYTSLVVDLACKLLGIDFRIEGRNMAFLDDTTYGINIRENNEEVSI